MSRSNVIPVGLMLASLLFSCDEDTTSPAGFDVEASSGDESAGLQSVTFNVGSSASDDRLVTFEVSGSASLNGDYTLLTPLPLTVKAGSTTATLEFRVTDESIIEAADEKINFTITAIGGGAPGTSKLTYTYTIADNDEIPTEGMQVDLTWNLGAGADIDAANLDLYLAYDVVVEDDAVQSMQLIETVYSENASGFESYVLPKGLKDTEYYVVVVYKRGTVAVPFELNFSDATNGTRNGTGSFAATEAGMAMFYGPIQKSGNTFSREGAPSMIKYRSGL